MGFVAAKAITSARGEAIISNVLDWILAGAVGVVCVLHDLCVAQTDTWDLTRMVVLGWWESVGPRRRFLRGLFHSNYWVEVKLIILLGAILGTFNSLKASYQFATHSWCN